MAEVHFCDRHSPEPMGSIARASDVAMVEANRRHGFSDDFDYRDLEDMGLRDQIHGEVCSRVRELLGQE